MPEPNVTPEEMAVLMSQDPNAINNMVEFANLMVEADDIPLGMKLPFWGFLNKETTLSKSEQIDRIRSENRFCITRNLFLMNIPQDEIDVTTLLNFANAQNRTTIRTNRSVGGFERQALTTQIRQLITNKDAQTQDKGFLSGIKKKLGFGPKDREIPGGGQ